MKRWLVLILAAACGGSSARPKQPEKAFVRDEANESRCSIGFRRAPEERRGPQVMEKACAALHLRPVCQQALVAASDNPSEQRLLDAMLITCRDSYCHDLAAPKPEACQGAPADPWVGAYELDCAILALDAQMSREQAGALSLFREFRRPLDPVGSAGPASLEISVEHARRGMVVRYQGQEWKVKKVTARDAFAPLLQALPPPAKGTKVLVAADSRLPYSSVVALLDALKAAGYSNFALSVASE